MSADAAGKPWPAMSIAQAHQMLAAPGTMFEVGEAVVRGITLKVWKNAPPNLTMLFEAGQLHAGRDYLVYENERVTFDSHRRAALSLANVLKSKGVTKGDRVAIVMRNLPEWSVAFWACVLAGAVATPLNAWWTGPELEYGLQDSGSKVAIVDVERWERLREHIDACPDLERVFVSRLSEEVAHPRVEKLEEYIGASNLWPHLPTNSTPAEALGLAPDDDVAIFYTSGTTGKPKGAVITHRNILSNILNGASAQARGFLRRGEAPPQPDPTAPQKASLLSVPFFHATGCFAMMLPAMMTGNKMVMQRRFDAEAALGLIEREKITQIGGVPTIAWQILEHPRFGDFDTSSIETVAYGGAPSAPELVKRIRAQFPKSSPGQGWGMTETSATAVSNFAEDYENRPASCGVPSMTGEVRIVGEGNADMPVGEVGELWYRGPIVVRGYWNKPQATADTFVDGWVKTGDLAKVDEEGFVYIVDRAKDMLIRGGENIYCVEVENALYDHPAVMDAAVVGIEHMTLGEEPAAVVHLKPGHEASEADLRQHVADRIAAFKVPVKVLFLPEPLPRNANGKILKSELKKLFA
jgi:long-chain acyl-CoA synthetase